MQSLNSNYNNLISLLDSIRNPSILTLTEIWRPVHPKNIITGYQPLIMTVRPKQKGGGCGIFLKTNITLVTDHCIPPWPLFTTFELCHAVVKPHMSSPKKHHLLIISMYRPPKVHNMSLFFSELENLLAFIESTKLNTILTGDMNINVSKKNKTTTSYCNLCKNIT